LTDQVLFEPELIIVDSARENNLNIEQQKILADNNTHKLKLCAHVLQHDSYKKAIVFANKRETVNSISSWLQSCGLTSAVIHSDVKQDVRNKLLRQFRNDELKIIISTDVASRGLDITDLDLIINFDVPRNGEDYMHRIGRTGRMFETGVAITLVDAQEWNRMISIENFLDVKCEQRSIKSLPGKYRGPENRKSSGKAYGARRRKAASPKKARNKSKLRARDRKNIGKRRKPTERSIHKSGDKLD
jgi:ATP-dependent RNA helicase SrmB